MISKLIVKRVRYISHISDEISTGARDIPDFEVGGKDEISDLSRSFNRMRRSLEKAMEMLS